MITVYNIRGTNGSGKSTLARSFIAGDPAALPNQPGVNGSPTMVDLCWYDSPTKADPGRRKAVEGYCSPRLGWASSLDNGYVDALVVGSYRTACGGLDAVPNFDTAFAAIQGAITIHQKHGTSQHKAVVAEGIIASTVWGSWGMFAEAMSEYEGYDAQMAFCYLDTPLEVCLERIRRRQEAAGKVRDIKTELVADKIRAIAATREKALAAGALVYDLPWGNAGEVLSAIMTNDLIYPDVDNSYYAREHHRASA